MNVVLLSERPERHALRAEKEPPRPKEDRHKPADSAGGENACAHVAHSTSALSTIEKDMFVISRCSCQGITIGEDRAVFLLKNGKRWGVKNVTIDFREVRRERGGKRTRQGAKVVWAAWSAVVV
jgi:hypothetical protein